MTEKSLKVVGAAVVLPLETGSERYLYRNAVAETKGFTKAGLDHAVKVGLIEIFDGASVEDPADDEKPTDSWNHDRIDAWVAAQTPPIELVNPDAAKPFVKGDKLAQIAAELEKRKQ
jgi:hypothetical protein